MTDTTAFGTLVINQIITFMSAYENLQLLADRIAADTALSTATAVAMQARRPDLTAANFDNFRLAVQAVATLLNNTNAGVPTGGTVKLAFYQLM